MAWSFYISSPPPATQVFPQAGPQLSLKPGFPALGGKYTVIEKAGIGMGHEPPRMYPSPLRGLERLWQLILRPLLGGYIPTILSAIGDESEAGKCKNSRPQPPLLK